jgi:hypothetical protein
MKNKWALSHAAGIAVFLASAWTNTTPAAETRVIFNVKSETSCQSFFNNPAMKQLTLKKHQLVNGTYTDPYGGLKVDVRFTPDLTATLTTTTPTTTTSPVTQLIRWESLGTDNPVPTPDTPPKAVNGVIIKTGNYAYSHSWSGDWKVVYYPDALLKDSNPPGVIFDSAPKAIKEVMFCYGGPEEAIGYNECPLVQAQVDTVCANLGSTPAEGSTKFFLFYDVVTLAKGGSTLPASCSCGAITERACNPDPNKPDACETAGNTLQNSSTQSLLATDGSCVVTLCSTVLGKTRCQQKTISGTLQCP